MKDPIPLREYSIHDPGTTTQEPQHQQAPAETVADDGTPKTYYANPEEWVNDWLLPHYRRELGGSKRRWDPNWWHYEEVGGALEALWQAWEYLRRQPGTGVVVFYRDYLYPMMDQITAPDGPFWNYHGSYPSVDSKTIPKPWETTPTLPGWYRKAGDPREQ